MASGDLREELTCSICLDLYTEPVSLKCGHNFCQDCIATALDTQEESGEYSCPECREQYTERPPLENNRKLSNIVDHFRPAHQKKTGIHCTFCNGATPASKTCLHCEASFCEKHLSNHSKSSLHVLIEPTISFEYRKCSTHGEVLTYYCTQDSVCICTSCWVAGEHRGHQVEFLAEASEKKITDVIQRLKSERQETEKRIQNLENHRTCKEKLINMFKHTTPTLIQKHRYMLDNLEERLLCEITTEQEKISQSVSDLIRQQETRKDELSRKTEEIEELYKSTDPLTFLRNELIRDGICTKKSWIFCEMKNVAQLDVVLIAQRIRRGLLDISYVLKEHHCKKLFPSMDNSDILLDPKTANNYITISKDLKSASCCNTPEIRPDVPERFKTRQVLSRQCFSGTKFWEVDVSAAKEWIIGMATSSIQRKTEDIESYIGHNDKSWGLSQRTGLQAWHNNSVSNIDSNSSLKTVLIHLDYNVGHLSFYQLCNPIRHLHTFTTTFNEPLHAAFHVFPNSSITLLK